MSWQLRREGATKVLTLPSAQAVLDGVKDGEWAASDGVRGPGDTAWRLIESHPQFEEAIAEMEEPELPPVEETHLDMNQLIDVSLVLLVFFILTATYATLRRTVDLPPEPPAEESQRASLPKLKDMQERVFKVVVRMEGDDPVVRVEGKVVPLADLESEMTEYVKRKGKPEAFIDVSADVKWAVEIKVIEATRGAEVRRIYWPKGK